MSLRSSRHSYRTYGLTITSIEDRNATTFTATDIPTASGAVHQYTIDWEALSQGEKGATVQIDSDGDGIFEQTVTTGDTFQLPIASFTYSPENPVVNETIAFNASSSYDPDGNITDYEWNFGDGNITNTTDPIITHTYVSAGNYIVNLTITDDDGATDTDTTTLTITKYSPPPEGIIGLLKPPEQPQYFKEKSSVQGTGYVAIDKKIQDWNAAIDVEEHMKGFGEFALESREILNGSANISNPEDPNYFHQKMINFQGNATNRLINTEKFESPAIFGGTGTRVNELFDVSEIQKQESSSIKTISAPGERQSHSFETTDEFSGTWSTHSEWQKTCQKEIEHYQLFKGNFSVQKELTFEREVVTP
ncbi:PKD domain-containing protein [Methanophagales archaeon]|nr:MAG: PKD domain-containing protein [Methanophagales archaeon]